MVSGGKEENIEIRLYNLNKNLKSSFSAVKRDIINLTKEKEHLVQDINNKLSKIREDFVKNQDFQSEIDSLNEKHNWVLREIKKREKLKKELKEALKLKKSINSMIKSFEKANGIKKEFEDLKNTVVDVNEFKMQANKFDARIKKRAQDISSMKKELDELEKRFIDKSYFNKQLSDLRQEIQSVRKNSVENNYFKRNLNRLDSRFRRIIDFLKKHPEIRKEDKKKISEIEKIQGKEKGALKSAWNGIVDFFTEEIEEPKGGKPKKIKKKKKPRKRKKQAILKRIWNAIIDFFTEEESEEEWFEKREKPKKKKKKPKALKKTDKRNKFLKYMFVLIGVLLIFFFYYSNFLAKIIGFIISYKYNILLGIIILAVIIFLSERREKK
ncbi:MAG: hypothetical protein KJ968_04105 [Nanoarchaeota archaeon]|nr:hypothetical protein [Nanoarchaeota archaeon]MBU4284268.1 hypothetical protein [Nanoarchaeota archaeon]